MAARDPTLVVLHPEQLVVGEVLGLIARDGAPVVGELIDAALRSPPAPWSRRSRQRR